VFHLEAVFLEDPIVQSRIKMGKAARDGARSDSELDRPFARFGKVRIGVGWNGKSEDKK
jgi:hypothetical protein